MAEAGLSKENRQANTLWTRVKEEFRTGTVEFGEADLDDVVEQPSTPLEKEKDVLSDPNDPNDEVQHLKTVNVENFPHERENCPCNPFNPHPPDDGENKKHCPQCYCFVCGTVASECENWTGHCNAHASDKWKQERFFSNYPLGQILADVNGDPQGTLKVYERVLTAITHSWNLFRAGNSENPVLKHEFGKTVFYWFRRCINSMVPTSLFEWTYQMMLLDAITNATVSQTWRPTPNSDERAIWDPDKTNEKQFDKMYNILGGRWITLFAVARSSILDTGGEDVFNSLTLVLRKQMVKHNDSVKEQAHFDRGFSLFCTILQTGVPGKGREVIGAVKTLYACTIRRKNAHVRLQEGGDKRVERYNDVQKKDDTFLPFLKYLFHANCSDVAECERESLLEEAKIVEAITDYFHNPTSTDLWDAMCQRNNDLHVAGALDYAEKKSTCVYLQSNDRKKLADAQLQNILFFLHVARRSMESPIKSYSNAQKIVSTSFRCAKDCMVLLKQRCSPSKATWKAKIYTKVYDGICLLLKCLWNVRSALYPFIVAEFNSVLEPVTRSLFGKKLEVLKEHQAKAFSSRKRKREKDPYFHEKVKCASCSKEFEKQHMVNFETEKPLYCSRECESSPPRSNE